MITKTLTYLNPITDTEVTKTFYFGLTRVEALRLNAKWQDWGGLEGRYDALVEAGEDIAFIMETVEELILTAYGVRVGDEIEKSESLRNQFAASEAYSVLFTGLLMNEGPEWDPNEFVKGIVPKNLNLNDTEQTPRSASDLARARSEASMQGFKRPQQKPTTQTAEADLPFKETAPDGEPKEGVVDVNTTQPGGLPMNMTPEQYDAFILWQNGQKSSE